ncbi:hypothetical protein AIOL_001861 [Candidatus Rhodobacter oscarellae]|uniref:VWFA domain-containing protein n=1 Tax=Candidatus Rhodobacter oscarellae TaxID=1675527 RepID=A0A0J9E524_9RHOB|nr:hypothetical protein [Candidatus Rhodobacter lobularis]KMW56904.1 hypothetical protein AIOL_001861 [Candidatus Rhodobacter lobularis]
MSFRLLFRWRTLLWLVLVSIVFLQAAQARVIGIVYDDSGSMTNAGTVHLPTFGAQFIVSTLEGNDPNDPDRLFYGRLNQSRPSSPGINTTGAQQSAIQTIERQFTSGGGNTPIKMVGDMLDAILAAQRDGEEVYLVVITDGQFGGDFNRFQRQVQAALRDAKGPIRSEFVLINPSDSDSFVQSVRDQDVFPFLNTSFNGSADDGFHNVTNFDAMFEAVKAITARISGTEDLGQANNIRKSGATMTLESPFSISRIVAVSSSEDGSPPPSVTSTSFTATDTFSFDSGMTEPDRASGWNKIVKGYTQHFVFRPALSPGKHTLEYDRQLNNGSFLLFEADAVVDLRLFDPSGQMLQPGADGVIEVTLDAEYDLQSQVYSEKSTTTPVPFSEIDSNARFKTDVRDPTDAQTSIPMPRNDAADRAEGKATFTQVGEHTLRSVLRWPGFVSPTSKSINVRVLDRRAEMSISIVPTNQDGSGNITFDVLAGGTSALQRIAVISVHDATGLAVEYSMTLSELPGWAELQRANGDILEPSDTVPVSESLTLVVDGSAITSGNQVKTWPFVLAARAASPVIGEVEATGTILPVVAPVVLNPAGHSKDPTGTTPLPMNGTELRENKHKTTGKINGLDFQIRDALSSPEIGKNIEVITNAPLGVGIIAEVNGDLVSAYPTTAWWCPCILYFRDAPIQVFVEFDDGNGLQQARSPSQTLQVTVTAREAITSCLLILLAILIFLYLLKALLNGLATQRFPKRSIAEIDDNSEVTKKQHLRGRNRTFFKVLAWPIFGVPHERTSVGGIALQARRGGCLLLLTGSNLGYVSDTYDDLEEFREDNPKKDQVAIGWLEEFQRKDGFGEKIRLFRDISEAR